MFDVTVIQILQIGNNDAFSYCKVTEDMIRPGKPAYFETKTNAENSPKNVRKIQLMKECATKDACEAPQVGKINIGLT